MKIFPLKFMSPFDRAKVLPDVMDSKTGICTRMNNNSAKSGSVLPADKFNSEKAPDYNRQVDIMGSRFPLRELRGIYRRGLERLSNGKIDK